MPMTTLRPEVQRFAAQMEARLQANDDKGGWQRESFDSLLSRLGDEYLELAEAVSALEVGPDGQSLRDLQKRVIKEAADIANFAMMVADNTGGLS